MLREGEQLISESGGWVTVGRNLGIGGWSEVYEGHTNDGRAVAIKWYLPTFQSDALRSKITYLVQQKAPSDHFLWPADILQGGDGHFGYWMPLRPTSYTSLSDVLRRKVSIRFRELVCAAQNIVAAFKALQRNGLFWSDITDGNVFVNPSTGHILICDNDHIGSVHQVPSVIGTPRFMAPEVVRGEMPPSVLSDGYSMAILLFLLLMNDHPLQGEAESRIHVLNSAAMRRIYGFEPVFIFDPADLSNRPVPGVHVNAPIFWPLYPPVLRKIFTRVFTEGAHDPRCRPSFAEWEAALSSACGAIVNCHHCGRENFYWLEDGVCSVCWGCSAQVREQMKLVVNGDRFVLAHGAKIYERDLSGNSDDPSPGLLEAEVVRHPTLGRLGLRNMGASRWTALLPGAVVRTVEAGQWVSLVPETRIDFGAASAVVET